MSKFYFTWNHKKTRGFLMISGGYKLIDWLNSLHIKGEIWRRSLVLLSGYTSWKSSKYGVFSGPYFPVFTGKYGSKKSLYFDAFRAVLPFPQGFFFFFFWKCRMPRCFVKEKEQNICLMEFIIDIIERLIYMAQFFSWKSVEFISLEKFFTSIWIL